MSAEPALRELRPDDYEGMVRFERRIGFRATPLDYWQQLWNNPTLNAPGPRVSPGWVLQADGEIVGHFGSIPMPYAFGPETVMTAAAKGVGVDPEFRKLKQAPRLARAFFEQQNVDVLLSTTTNAVAGRFFLKFDAHPIPQRNYDKALYWILRPEAFVRSALLKKQIAGAAANAAGKLASPFMRGAMLLRGHGKRGSAVRERIDVIDVDDVGPEFDDLWNRKRTESKRLLATRSSELIAWHFQKVGNKTVTRVLCCRRHDRLVGYLIVIREDTPAVKLNRSRIVDIFVERDDPETIDSLLRVALGHAADTGSDMLEVVGFPDEVRRRLLLARPFVRQLPAWGYFYKALPGRLREELTREEHWYACQFDGDASLRGRQHDDAQPETAASTP